MDDLIQMIKEMNKKEFLSDLILGGIFTILIFKILPYIVIWLS